MKTFIYSLITLLLSVNLAFAKEVNLGMLLHSASQNSLVLKGKKDDIGIESARLESTKSDYYPVLSLSYNNEYNRDLDGRFGGVESVGDTVITNGTRYQSSLSLNFNYELYHFGATDTKVALYEKEVRVRRYNWCEEEQNLHTNILDQYATALKAQTSITNQSKIVDIRRKIYTQKERLYQAGKSSKFELGNEAIAIIDLERSIEQARSQYDDALLMLTELSHIELTQADALLPLQTTVSTEATLTPFNETAEGVRLQAQIQQKHDEVLMHDRNRLPSIVMYSNYYLYGSDPDDYQPAIEALRRSSWKVGVGLRWTIFEGFRFDSDMTRLKLEQEKLKDEYEERQRMYTYEQKMKEARISHLSALQERDAMAVKESEKSVTMSKRLRENAQMQSVDALLIELENVERYLTLATEQIEHAYEQRRLDIMRKGVDQCSLH